MKTLSTLIIVVLVSLINLANANNFKTEKWKTTNGVQVIFYPAMEVPMLDISLAFAAGSAQDGAQYGLAALTSQMMNQGNLGQDAISIAESLENTGSQYNTEINRDMAIFHLRTLVTNEKLAQSSAIFAQIINHPDFPETALSLEKKQQLMAIKQHKESPEEIAQFNFLKTLYLQHPYAHSIKGTHKTVQTISRSQVVDFYKRYYVGNNAILVMVGAISHKTAHQIAEQLTRDLSPGQPAPQISKAQQLTQAKNINIPYPSSQTVIRLGQIGIDHHDPNYFPLLVGNYILGGGMLVSQLAQEVREKRGLTYGINSQFTPMLGKGPFLISLSTKNTQTDEALQVIKHVLFQYIDKGPTNEEINAAKQYLTGSFPLSLSGNRKIANILLRMHFYHLPDDFLNHYKDQINAVNQEQIKQAFKQNINPGNLLLVTVGA